MAELLTAAQMRTIEQAAIDGGAATGRDLMERAGRGVVEAVFAAWPDLATTAHRAVVLCGPGNNGGDGFVVARLLKEWGWEVEVRFHGEAARLPPDARANHDRWCAMGPVGRGAIAGPADLIVDALFGTGLARAVEDPELREAFGRISEATAAGGVPRTVAVDLPSGLDADTGEPIGGLAPRVMLTVTFHAEKRAHRIGAGPEHCGRVVVADIGLPAGPVAGAVRLVEGPAAPLGKATGSHKYDHGHALVLSGGPGRGGASRLAARGALRIGAGLVTLGCPPAATQENAAQLNAIMLKPLKEVTDLIEFLADGRIDAVCLGPGLGRGERAQELVTAVLAAERATVLDADALTVHEDDPPSLFYQLHAACVLTPHAGEFRRLFPDLAARLAASGGEGAAFSRIDATAEAAGRAGCTVLLKGPDTVIADKTGAAVVHAAHYDRAAPWLATAGAGDVLAGFVTGLLARGVAPMEAAATAAWLHAECALSFGPGLLAEDLPEELPRVLRALGL
jgi:ADP-dependent NAD(P)H-hydrate dehydratase / NAD(P)H-hydrate epimerase